MTQRGALSCWCISRQAGRCGACKGFLSSAHTCPEQKLYALGIIFRRHNRTSEHRVRDGTGYWCCRKLKLGMDGPLPGAPRSTSYPCRRRYFTSGTCFAVPHRTAPYLLPCLRPPELGTPVDPTITTGMRDCCCRSASRTWSVYKQSVGDAGSRWPRGPEDSLCVWEGSI